MTYMDEWEYNLWLSIHRNELTEPPAVEQTASGEVGKGSAQLAQPVCSKSGPQKE